MERKLYPLVWRKNLDWEEARMSDMDKMGFHAAVQTVVGVFQVTYWPKEWRVRHNGMLVGTAETLVDALEGAYQIYTQQIDELYE